MRIQCFQHVPFENPGTIIEWAEINDHSISYTCFFEDNYLIPALDSIDVLLIMGGAMNVDEETKYPWLTAEKQFIRQAIIAGKKLIGICLGAQLIASALGHKVFKGKEKEIGFFPVKFTDEALDHPLFNHFPDAYTVFHWHGDTFDLPFHAIRIASTAVCANQAFLMGKNVLGIQFHFEMNETIIEDMLLYDGHELKEGGNFIQTPVDIRKATHYLAENKKHLFMLLDKFMNG